MFYGDGEDGGYPGWDVVREVTEDGSLIEYLEYSSFQCQSADAERHVN